MTAEFSINYDLNMPFIALDGYKPAMLITKAGDKSKFPVSIKEITGALISLMNGLDLIKTITNETNRQVYYSKRGSDAISFRSRDVNGGMTEPGLVLTINGALSEEEKEIVRKPFTPEFMSKLCGAIEEPVNLVEHNAVSKADHKMF